MSTMMAVRGRIVEHGTAITVRIEAIEVKNGLDPTEAIETDRIVGLDLGAGDYLVPSSGSLRGGVRELRMERDFCEAFDGQQEMFGYSQAVKVGGTIHVAGTLGIGEELHIPESMAEQVTLAQRADEEGKKTTTVAPVEPAPGLPAVRTLAITTALRKRWPRAPSRGTALQRLNGTKSTGRVGIGGLSGLAAGPTTTHYGQDPTYTNGVLSRRV